MISAKELQDANYAWFYGSLWGHTLIFLGFIENVKFQHELAKKDVADYIENPINAFTLIKRIVNDWKDLFEYLKFHEAKLEMETALEEFRNDYQLPDENELKGAIKGLRRLQTIYKLSAEQMANGKKYGKPLDWRDCFEIATTYYDEGHFHQAIEWLKLSLLKLQESKESKDLKSNFINHIKEYLSLCYQSIGESELAFEQLDDILKTDPNNIAKITRDLFINDESAIEIDEKLKPAKESETIYARLCRGERESKIQKLDCKLETNVHPFFILSPLKIEPLLENPPVILYHNLLNDNQIAELLKATENKLVRSTVLLPNGTLPVENRISQQTYLKPKNHGIVEQIYKLVGIITGFNMISAEAMQVANYGIGGQYESHYDYLSHFLNKTDTDFVGDRISTNMFYLSDVEEGGYTVFPFLDIYSKPIKGSMIMWYNLHRDIHANERTLHAGCPVLKGSKKIANIWIHSDYQELQRPCTLENDSLKGNDFKWPKNVF
ncbi:prolyl-4-hydroxylase-alpha SG2 isoform 2-T2 [Cochliomyia hominivorax]